MREPVVSKYGTVRYKGEPVFKILNPIAACMYIADWYWYFKKWTASILYLQLQQILTRRHVDLRSCRLHQQCRYCRLVLPLSVCFFSFCTMHAYYHSNLLLKMQSLHCIVKILMPAVAYQQNEQQVINPK